MSRRPGYQAWSSMKDRCTNPNHKYWARYGGRGIRVCAEWSASFDAFSAYVGPRPSIRHSIDRIDSDGNYEPGNVRWATHEEQQRNRTNNNLLTIDGVTKSAADWAEEYGIAAPTLRMRIQKGWSHERALKEPVDTRARKTGKKEGIIQARIEAAVANARRAAIEEAARLVERGIGLTCGAIARDIRALLATPKADDGKGEAE